jgi:HAD superfamily hydrolase (TIGR01509 family)
VTGRLAAVVLDFDGTIVDSEMPIYRAAAAALAEMGHDLDVAGWAGAVGHGHDESYRALCRAVGADFDRADFDARYQLQDRAWERELPALPGVEELLDALGEAGVPVGVASSSSERWVEGHLARLGLRDRIAVVASRDQVGGRPKPDPASYRWAVQRLGADPAATVAVEDSAPGIAAARGAGLRVVAVPSEITRHTDLPAAHATVGSLLELTPASLAAVLDAAP